MNIRTFLQLVEIKTKAASLFPFIFATLFTLYRYGRLDLRNLALMFISLLFFDMTTTAINNYMDYKKAVNLEDRDSHNIIATASIPLSLVRLIITSMLILAIAAGLVLVGRTGPVVLLLGILAFAVGILYTWGPVPISRMPLGEILSGLMMGCLIVFISVYIHRPEIAVLSYSKGHLLLDLHIPDVLAVILVSAPFVLYISNLMLANNICDLEQDIRNDRFLLPYYLGRTASLRLYTASGYGAYLFLLLAVVLRILPLWSLLTLLSLPLIRRQLLIFSHEQIKSRTFVTAVRNLSTFSLFYILPLIISLFF